MFKHSKGFTLIELLVVISIISLLSSIVMATLNSARDKASVAAGLKFDKSVFNALGSEAVLVWDFEETGNTITDWSNGVTGTMTAGVTRVNGVTGKALNFNGSSYVTLDKLRIKQIADSLPSDPDVVLVTAWVYIRGYDSDTYSNIVTNIPKVLFFSIKSDGKMWTMYNGSYQISNGSVPLNKWTHVALQIDNNTGVKYFINGKLDTDLSIPGLVYNWLPNLEAYIGTWDISSSKMNGMIDDIRLYYKGVLQ